MLTHPVEIRSFNGVLWPYNIILVGRHRNAGSHHKTLVTRPHGSDTESKERLLVWLTSKLKQTQTASSLLTFFHSAEQNQWTSASFLHRYLPN